MSHCNNILGKGSATHVANREVGAVALAQPRVGAPPGERLARAPGAAAVESVAHHQAVEAARALRDSS